LICAYNTGQQPERALKFFEVMKQRSVVPDVVAYNALISACEKANQLEKALELFKMM